MSTPIRFKGVVDSTANIELGKYQGRIGFDTTISRYIAYYDATNSAVLARRDIAETFAGIRNNGAYQDSLGVERISSTGAVIGSTLKASNLPGVGARPLVADALGVIDDQDAATFRTTIGVPETVTREFSVQSLPITNAAPDEVTLGPSGSMKSFAFDGGTQVEEMFYHIDVNHNYVAGTPAIPHAHWFQRTDGTGTVVFHWDVQWIDAGGPVVAPVAYPCAAVDVNGTAWAEEQRSDATVPGTGHTYNSRLCLRLYRDPALDTYTGDVVLTSVGVHYTADPLQEG